MTSVVTLPGIAFEAVPRVIDESLPRMDVAGFVGFAASGPMDIPVLVEDPVAFRDVFGPDPELARTDDGTPVQAHLGPAVDAFFANGGRRAWVVRVAATGTGGAVTNRFAVPGLFVPGSPAEGASGWRAVTLPARSAGAWSDSLTVGAALEVTTSLPVVVDPGSLVLDHATDVVAGDLLRVVLTDDAALLVEVADVKPDPRGRMIVFDPRQGYLLTRRRSATGATVYRLGDGPPEPVPSFTTDVVAGEGLVVVAAAEPVGQADVLLTVSRADEGVALLTLGEEQPHGASPGTRRFAVQSSVGVSGAPDDWPSLADTGTTPVVAEIQRLRLTVRDGEAVVAELQSLGVSSAHPRSLAGLPADDRVFTVLAGTETSGGEGNGPNGPPDRALTPFERECLAPRFPLAGSAGSPLVLPLGATTDPTAIVFGGQPSRTDYPPAPVRNGLGRFDATLFVDPALAGLGVDTILPTAWDLVHVRRPPRRPTGPAQPRPRPAPGPSQQPGRVGAQRLQHAVPPPAIGPFPRRDQQRAVHQMCHYRPDTRPGHCLGGLQRERPREHRHRPEHPSLLLAQQPVAPLHRRRQRPVPPPAPAGPPASAARTGHPDGPPAVPHPAPPPAPRPARSPAASRPAAPPAAPPHARSARPG